MATEFKAEPGQRFAAVLLPETNKVLDDKRYYGPMLEGLSEGLLESGILLRPVQCLQEYQKEHFLRTPRKFYTGVAFLGPLYASKLFIQAVVENLAGPKVMLDHHFEDIAMHSVREDAIAGMRMITEHLLSLGHRNIAYLDLSNLNANPWKREGVNLALKEAGMPELQRGWVAGCRDNFTDVVAALDWFRELSPQPTAVICCDDIRALLMLQSAAERGLRVPQDLSITGFGDYAVQTGRSEILTSMRVDSSEMGRRGARLIAGHPDASPQSVLVAPQLVVRGTTAAPQDPA
jgi:LacI family transcriptional regulator, galactose operon repressor